MRENLSFGGTLVIKWFVYVICILTLFSNMPEVFAQGQLGKTLSFLPVFLFLAILWPLCDVYILDEHIVVRRFLIGVQLAPEDIADVNFFGSTRFVRMTLKTDTSLGKTIFFVPNFKTWIEADAFAAGHVFEKIGRFCGWRS